MEVFWVGIQIHDLLVTVPKVGSTVDYYYYYYYYYCAPSLLV